MKLNRDGTFTAFFGSKKACGDVPNRLDTPKGWNFMMRVYRPAPSGRFDNEWRDGHPLGTGAGLTITLLFPR